MNVTQLAEQLRRDNQFMKDVTRWEVIPPREARTLPFPETMDGRLKDVLGKRGIHALYTHQAHSLEAIGRGVSFNSGITTRYSFSPIVI